IKRWRKTRQQIRDEVDANGWNDERKSYVQSYGSTAVDAAVPLLPSFDFIAYDDPRMVSTTDAIWKDLDEGDGLLRRYRSEDNLDGGEGGFVACTFWLVECLARQRRFDEARKVYERAMATANDLGLFAEEYAPRSGELLGNFPQGISHFS